MTSYERIKEYLDNLETNDLVYIHNQYCYASNYPDDTIYSMEDFDEIFSGKEPWEIARTCYYGNFCPAHDYFWFNGYGNACSSDFPAFEKIDTGEIASYVLDNENTLGISDLEDMLEDMGV